MENQLGCVLVFKPGVDPKEVVKRLKALEDLVDSNYYIGGTPRLEKFNPDHGGPVWYVP